MDLIFKCPKCGQELEVDASGAGEEIECPSCNERILIPASDAAPAPAPVPEPPVAGTSWTTPAASVMASSAAAKIVMHLSVPAHDKPAEHLIAKALTPLEVAAKESDRQLRIRCIRHLDCVEVGHDRFEEMVSKFLAKIGEQCFISLSTITYTYIDAATQKILTGYGVLILYKG